jgi:hypothetical protein
VSPPPPSATRRTALTGALVGLATVAGCDDDGPREGPAIGPSTGAPVPDDEGAADPDTALVEEVVAGIGETAAMVAATRRRHRDLRGPLRLFVHLHTAHLEALEAPAPAPLLDGRPGLDQVRRAEKRLQGQLADAAVRAESGALARLLASMAAAVAQHLAVLR